MKKILIAMLIVIVLASVSVMARAQSITMTSPTTNAYAKVMYGDVGYTLSGKYLIPDKSFTLIRYVSFDSVKCIGTGTSTKNGQLRLSDTFFPGGSLVLVNSEDVYCPPQTNWIWANTTMLAWNPENYLFQN